MVQNLRARSSGLYESSSAATLPFPDNKQPLLSSASQPELPTQGATPETSLTSPGPFEESSTLTFGMGFEGNFLDSKSLESKRPQKKQGDVWAQRCKRAVLLKATKELLDIKQSWQGIWYRELTSERSKVEAQKKTFQKKLMTS